MKDFLNQDVKVGDKVITLSTCYKELYVGTITKITNCFIFVQSDKTTLITKRYPDQVVLLKE